MHLNLGSVTSGLLRRSKKSLLFIQYFIVNLMRLLWRLTLYDNRTLVLAGALLLTISTVVHLIAKPSDMEESSWMDFWTVRLGLNLLGYACIFLPGYFILRWVRNSNYLDRAGSGFLSNIIRLCTAEGDPDKGSVEEGGKAGTSPPPEEETLSKKAKNLLWCTGGLLGSYLLWGFLQERIMTFKYGDPETGETFKNSQFLVFMNRILALVFACVYLSATRQPKHNAPAYKYSFSSFSNIMSSYCQYEVLKYVSFPTQVLAKSSKVIPVMLMGKLMSKKSYEYYEYVTAIMISIGVGIFTLTSKDSVKGNGTSTTFSGVLLLLGYLLFDAFTSNWQGNLFKKYKMSSIQMMAGVNFFSVTLTFTTLIQQGGFFEASAFMMKYPTFMYHVCILSVCSATGQLFIFYTINQFGPVTFTIIMTLRQGLAILISCIHFHHPVTVFGVGGIGIVFFAIFIRLYMNSRKKKTTAVPTPANLPTNSITVAIPKS